MHNVAILALDGVVPFDLTIPFEVFGRVRPPSPQERYQVRICSPSRTIHAAGFTLHATGKLADIARADTVVIPGIENTRAPIPQEVVSAIHRAWKNGARIASICTGAFILAATGLLRGQRATTHWLAAAEFAEKYPDVLLDPKVLFVDNGRIITSAGACAGLDMCFHLVRKDHGHSVAAYAARLAVAPLDRQGGQAQFIRHEAPACTSTLAPVLQWMGENSHRTLTIAKLARRAGMSSRTFARRFREQTGTTPLQWLISARIHRAQELLESTAVSVDRIATAVGLDSPSVLREHFRRVVGVSPRHYRSTFRRQLEPGEEL